MIELRLPDLYGTDDTGPFCRLCGDVTHSRGCPTAKIEAAWALMVDALDALWAATNRSGGPQFGRLGKDRDVPTQVRAALAAARAVEKGEPRG